MAATSKAAKMPIVVFSLLLDATIFSAAQLQNQGYAWTSAVCVSSYGLCDRPFLLGLIAGSISSTYFLHFMISKNQNGNDVRGE
jgi:formate-dependent nitrite reductase membrane component NrfD